MVAADGSFLLLRRISKNCAKLLFSELRQIFTNFDDFWQKDGKEAIISSLQFRVIVHPRGEMRSSILRGYRPISQFEAINFRLTGYVSRQYLWTVR